MALTRSFLTAMGIDSDKVNEIINAHLETVNGLKEERDKYKVNSEKLADVQKELDSTKKAKEKLESDDFEKKYNDLKGEFDSYKSGVQKKELRVAKETALSKLAKELNLSEEGMKKAIKYTNLDDAELDKDGNFKDSTKMTECLKDEWGAFIEVEGKKGAERHDPPISGGQQNDVDRLSKMSIEDYIKARKGN